jgi:transposase-like protein
MNTGMVEAPANSQVMPDDIEVALRCLALNSGKVRKTARDLGMSDASTLSKWRKAHQARYDTICTEVLPTIHARIAERCEALADTYATLEEETASQLADALKAKEIPARDLPATARNVATSKAINVDKAQVIRGQPRRDQERRDALELLRGIASRFPAVVVLDGSAVELEPLGATDKPQLVQERPES